MKKKARGERKKEKEKVFDRNFSTLSGVDGALISLAISSFGEKGWEVEASIGVHVEK